MEAVRGKKHPSDSKNGIKDSIYWKKFLTKVAQQPQKPHNGSNQIWATTSSYDFWGHQGHSCAMRAKRLGTREAGIRLLYFWWTKKIINEKKDEKIYVQCIWDYEKLMHENPFTLPLH
jgi:hypothetical protein